MDGWNISQSIHSSTVVAKTTHGFPLRKTNIALKNGDWKTIFLLGRPIFGTYVGFRGAYHYKVGPKTGYQ